MAYIAPLQALRYPNEQLANLVAPPYDVIGPSDRAALGKKSPHNIVHIDLPEGEGDAKYENARKLLRDFVARGVLKRDGSPCLLRYDQTFEPPTGGARITRRGFLALVRAEPYETRAVLPHERTLSGPKEDRYKLFVATEAALSPVFFLYTDPSSTVREVLASAQTETSFRTDDGIEHELATITDSKAIERVTAALRDRSLLIADGHHRYETTVRYSAMKDAEWRAQGKTVEPAQAHHFTLAFLADADDPGLLVFPTHRLVHSLSGFERQTFLNRAREAFVVEPHVLGADERSFVAALERAGESAPSLGLVFPDGDAAILSLRRDFDVDGHPALAHRPKPLRRTDVMLLHAILFESVLGMTEEAQAKQENIRYYKKANEAVRDVRNGEGQLLLLMNATKVREVREVCEAGAFMPQKSTFFFPKVPTGLAIHILDPNQKV